LRPLLYVDSDWEALGVFAAHSPELIGDLHRLLHSNDWRLQALAVYTLGQTGEAIGPTLLDLAKLLEDQHPGVRGAAVLAIASLGHHAAPLAHPIASRLAAVKDPAVRLHITAALLALKQDSRAGAADIEAALAREQDPTCKVYLGPRRNLESDRTAHSRTRVRATAASRGPLLEGLVHRGALDV
jgi:HEAT repeat protein